jgi:hypothetical protein
MSVLLILIAAVALGSVPPQAPAGVKTRAATQRAEALLAKARAARGGADKLQRVERLRLRTSGDVTTLLFPDVYRIEMAVPGGTLVTCFDGKDLWQVWPQQSPARPPAPQAPDRSRRGALGQLTRYSLTYLTRALPTSDVVAVAEGARTFGPAEGETIRFESARERTAPWWIVIGPDHLPRALVAAMSTAPDGPVAGYALSVLSDYRDVGGVRFPFTSQFYRLDDRFETVQTLAPVTLLNVDVNPTVSRADITKR